MNTSKKKNEEMNRDDSFLLISRSAFERIEGKIDTIYEKLVDSNQTAKSINGHLSEKQAMTDYKKSHTWFWEKRRSGTLPFSKIGKTIYYRIEDLQNLLQ